MYEKLEECPACKHPKFSNYMICKDHSVSGESFALVKCEKCNLVFTNPRPDMENIGRYYKSDNYISHTNKANNLINYIYKKVRKITLKQKVSLLKKYSNDNYLLDFGCGAGSFLNYCKNNNFKTEGFEPDLDSNKLATRETGQEIFNNIKQIKKSGKYDIITAWHVIEHVHDLRETIKLLRKRLKTNGVLFLAVPNLKSYDANHYKQYWAAYDVPRHFYHFSKESFAQLAKKYKLKIKHIEPMKYDAYYISLLSEKYKNGKTKFLSAYDIGNRSNRKATTTGEYSSLIYILGK